MNVTDSIMNQIRTNNVMDQYCQASITKMYEEIFRIMGAYPKILFFLVVSVFVLMLFIIFFKDKIPLLRDYWDNLLMIMVQFQGLASFLLVPATFGLSDDGIKWGYYIVCTLLVILLLFFVWKFYRKIRGRMQESGKTFKDILKEVPLGDETSEE